MDFADFDRLYEDEAIPVKLAGPDGRPLTGTDGEPVFVHLLPPNAPKVEERSDDIRSRRQARADEGELTAEDKRAFENEMLASLITGWSDNILWQGEPFAYSPSNAAKLISTKGGKLLRDFLLKWRFDIANAWQALKAHRANSDAGEDASTSGTKTQGSPAGKSLKPQRAKAAKAPATS